MSHLVRIVDTEAVYETKSWRCYDTNSFKTDLCYCGTK